MSNTQTKILEKISTELDPLIERSLAQENAIAAMRDQIHATKQHLGEVEQMIGVAKRRGEVGSLSAGESEREALGLWLKGKVRKDESALGRAAELLRVERGALEAGATGEGAELVPTPLLGVLLRVGADSSAVRPISRIEPMTSGAMTVPRLDTAPTVAIVPEEGTVPDGFGAAPFSAVTVTAKKISALGTASVELFDDSAIQLGDLIIQTFTESIGEVEDAQALEGDGTANNFTGLYTASGVNSVSVGAALTNLDPLAEALRKLRAVSVSAAATSTWILSPALWEAVTVLKVAGYSGDTNGAYRNAIGETEMGPTLLGRPVRFSNQISDARGTGTDETTAYLGAFGRGMIFGDRMLAAILVDPYSLADTGQIRIRVMRRVGISVAIPSLFTKVTGIQLS